MYPFKEVTKRFYNRVLKMKSVSNTGLPKLFDNYFVKPFL